MKINKDIEIAIGSRILDMDTAEKRMLAYPFYLRSKLVSSKKYGEKNL